jgi:hypothetical protein
MQESVVEAQQSLEPPFAAGIQRTAKLASIEDYYKQLQQADKMAGLLMNDMFLQLPRVRKVLGVVDDIQKMQVQLTAALKWLEQTDIRELQAQCEALQEQAQKAEQRARDRLEWLGRDREEIPRQVRESLDEFDKERAGEQKVSKFKLSRGGKAVERLACHATVTADMHSEARALQKDALSLSRKLLAILEAVPEQQALDAEKIAEQLEGQAVPSDGSDADQLPMDQASVADLYKQAVSTERHISALYAQSRAAELSFVSGMSPRSAQAVVEVSTPDRSSVDIDSLEKHVATGSEYTRHQQALSDALAATEEMAISANAMLAAAEASGDVMASEIALFDEQSRGEIDDAGVAQGPYSGQADRFTDESSRASSRSEGAGESGRGPSGTGAPLSGMRPGNDPEFRGDDIPSLLMRQSRSIGPSAVASPWTNVNSWYIIGPFTSGRSADINRRYTPENIINLDGVYTGPDGRKLQWRYYSHATEVLLFPEQSTYSVYYAWTQIK